LLNACRREAGVNDMGVEPVLEHCSRQYTRVFVRVRSGTIWADRSLENEGYVLKCDDCHDTNHAKKTLPKCERCGGRVKNSGPLWIGRLLDNSVLEQASRIASSLGLADAQKSLGSLAGLDDFPPYSFSIAKACSELRVSSVSPTAAVLGLRSLGYRCMMQPFMDPGIKTDATHAEFKRAISDIASKKAQADNE
jgi:tRNA G26 N,N-dimethylase Trm1